MAKQFTETSKQSAKKINFSIFGLKKNVNYTPPGVNKIVFFRIKNEIFWKQLFVGVRHDGGHF